LATPRGELDFPREQFSTAPAENSGAWVNSLICNGFEVAVEQLLGAGGVRSELTAGSGD
jgi:hypothetical protein